ncbi:MAG: hypothetical protein LBR55_00660 [Bacteroidales bacterium]|jgi:hypothetical protein|nr:hypothetical protein [Bacteroidales bacterium]
MNIYIDFDFRQDSKCGDPDTDSEILYETHNLLWNNKILPCGMLFDLKVIKDNYGRLLLKNNLYDNLSSDRMCPHFDGKYNGKFNGWLSDFEREDLKYKVRTIGGHIIFPAHKKNGFTINQARGVNRTICDRFDLTLECIRRFYKREQSPLYNTLVRYKDFFDLFIDFSGYVNFFLLQDFIDEEEKIKFSLPFDNFNRSPLPQTIDEYKQYKIHTIDLINSRNRRITLI